MRKEKDVLYIFVHVMKCAGSTLKEHILKNFGENEVLLLYGNEPPYLFEKQDIKRYINSLTKKQKDELKIIFGHRAYYGLHKLFPNREVRYVTFLRNPVDRAISHYNWDRMRYSVMPKYQRIGIFPKGKKDLSFESWFDNRKGTIRKENLRINNFISRFLFRCFFDKGLQEGDINEANLERMKRTLDKFYFIGMTNNPKDFLFLYHKLRITKFLEDTNVSEKYLIQKEIIEAKRFLSHKLKFDQELYEYASNLNKKFKRKHINFYFIVFYVWFKKIFYYIKEFYFFIRRLPYRLTLLPIFRLSAKLKKISPRYTGLVKFIKDTTGIK